MKGTSADYADYADSLYRTAAPVFPKTICVICESADAHEFSNEWR
jgi:hypothetical protein